MSSSKGTSNSNKTAHVMNLLRKSNPTPPQTEAAPVSPAQQAQPAPPSSQQPPAAPAAQVPPIITALNADAEVSSQIKDALSEALAEEEVLAAADQSAQVVEPVRNAHAAGPVTDVQADGADQEAQTAEAAQGTELDDLPHSPQLTEPVDAVDEIPASGADQETEPAHAAHAVGPMEATQTVGAGSVQECQSTEADPEEPVLINITQQLVEELADKYIRLFGLCSCSRCRKDVMALTLNALHPRYVVMPMWEFKIRSDMYSNHYSSEITAQLLRACRVVMDSPRHTLPDAPTTR